MPTTSASSPSAVRFVRKAAVSSRKALSSFSAATSTAPFGGADPSSRACASVRSRSMRSIRPSVPVSSCAVAMSATIGGSAATSAPPRATKPITCTVASRSPIRSVVESPTPRPSSRARSSGISTVSGSTTRRAKSVPRVGATCAMRNAVAPRIGSSPSSGTRMLGRRPMPTSASTTGAAVSVPSRSTSSAYKRSSRVSSSGSKRCVSGPRTSAAVTSNARAALSFARLTPT